MSRLLTSVHYFLARYAFLRREEGEKICKTRAAISLQNFRKNGSKKSDCDVPFRKLLKQHLTSESPTVLSKLYEKYLEKYTHRRPWIMKSSLRGHIVLMIGIDIVNAEMKRKKESWRRNPIRRALCKVHLYIRSLITRWAKLRCRYRRHRRAQKLSSLSHETQ